jgi:hypothetical protein
MRTDRSALSMASFFGADDKVTKTPSTAVKYHPS